jgi:hypothetical protein
MTSRGVGRTSTKGKTRDLRRPRPIPDYERLILMSFCHHNIISNSSFAWWGAWLNPREEKVVIAPNRWLAKPGICTKDVYGRNWIKVDESPLEVIAPEVQDCQQK